MLATIADIDAKSANLVVDDIERSVDKFPDNLAFIGDDNRWTYEQFDQYANQIAHWALAQGCKPEDSVAILANNRIEYVALWYGLSKVGVVSALVNFQLRAKSLAHCINAAETKIAIVDGALWDAWKSAQPHLSSPVPAFFAFGRPPAKMATFDTDVAGQPTTRPDPKIRQDIRAEGLFLKLFTSGTTGLPKVAKITHIRGQYYMRGFTGAADSGPEDRTMVVLPLYHGTGGFCGVGLALMRGGAVIVRPRFSASTFWQEAVQFEATIFMYVGEICRFLLNAPGHKAERQHHVRCIVGNGLPGSVWAPFVKRFNIPNVVEFYGATEGNISLVNVGNVVGAVGRIPKYLRHKFNGDIVRYDTLSQSYPKDKDGFFQRVKPGEVGELVGEIKTDNARFRYDGYANKRASEKKILRDVFKKDDMWFRTGDLFKRDKLGYYYFVDRMGDTFRWKAENVATSEVAAALSEFPKVEQANVYGVAVPGYDGKAGMASLVAQPDMDLQALHSHITAGLPPYARPVFLRISAESEITGTFKYKKTGLVKDGYDPTKIKDQLYINHPGTRRYEKLDKKTFAQIEAGEIRL